MSSQITRGEQKLERLQYGLTTALKPFNIPEWTGECELLLSDDAHVFGETRVTRNQFIATQHDGPAQALAIPIGTRGTVKISRVISGASALHLVVRVHANCDVTIEDEYHGRGSVAHSTILEVAPGSTVRYAILQDLAREQGSLAALHYETHARDANVTWFLCALGAETTQANVETLADKGSTIKNTAVVFGTGEQQFDLHATTRHTEGNSTSNMLTRGVFDDKSRAIYHGLIRINENSPDCDSYQKNEVILLSENAMAEAIPNLEIHNHRVRCSHGASIGKLDQEKLFYCTSRGIDPATAKRMITEGFLEPLFIAPWQHLIHERTSHS